MLFTIAPKYDRRRGRKNGASWHYPAQATPWVGDKKNLNPNGVASSFACSTASAVAR
jgi:hypothetical protein